MANNPEQMKAYREAFAQFDINKDGTISAGEFIIVMRELGFKLTSKEINAMMAEVDKNACEKINFPEFCSLMKKHAEIIDAAKRLRNLFKMYDPDDEGLISREDLRRTLAKMGKSFTDEEINAMFFEADLDCDGKINYHEFAMTWAIKNPLNIGNDLPQSGTH